MDCGGSAMCSHGRHKYSGCPPCGRAYSAHDLEWLGRKRSKGPALTEALTKDQILADFALFGLNPLDVYGGDKAELEAAVASDLKFLSSEDQELFRLHTAGNKYPVLKLDGAPKGGFFCRMFAALEQLFGCAPGDAKGRFAHFTKTTAQTTAKEGNMRKHNDKGSAEREDNNTVKPCLKVFFTVPGKPPSTAGIQFSYPNGTAARKLAAGEGVEPWEHTQVFGPNRGPSGHASGGTARGVWHGHMGNGVEHDPSVGASGVVMTLVCTLPTPTDKLDRAALLKSCEVGSQPLSYANSGVEQLLTEKILAAPRTKGKQLTAEVAGERG
jgi:hypothetical protein